MMTLIFAAAASREMPFFADAIFFITLPCRRDADAAARSIDSPTRIEVTIATSRQMFAAFTGGHDMNARQYGGQHHNNGDVILPDNVNGYADFIVPFTTISV